MARRPRSGGGRLTLAREIDLPPGGLARAESGAPLDRRSARIWRNARGSAYAVELIGCPPGTEILGPAYDDGRSAGFGFPSESAALRAIESWRRAGSPVGVAFSCDEEGRAARYDRARAPSRYGG